MPRHLHPQAGGDPSQGPVREFANEPPSPGVDNEFPDVPDGNRPDTTDESTDDESTDDESTDEDSDG